MLQGGIMSSIGVVLDACVLYPGSLRDTFLRAAEAGLFRLCLTYDILEEMKRNLIENSHMAEDKAQRIFDMIKNFFDEAFVTKHTLLIPSMPINEKDRHVLAAAIASGAQIIVTQNLKDFPPHHLAPFEVEALSADDFLIQQFTQNKEEIVAIIRQQASYLKKSSSNSELGLRASRAICSQFCKTGASSSRKGIKKGITQMRKTVLAPYLWRFAPKREM
jgi:predicted nucleic acid-binding protein